ncbi:dTMP kinase [Streptomyces sp. NPDC051677]|uniref:dTMP kinase n=1 Tax=Streptomyces sp. NPDC051677 TaxID=3365669 RepID=UPI0037CF9F57
MTAHDKITPPRPLELARRHAPDGGGHRPFVVLLGPDYAGKSTVLAQLAEAMTRWRFLSVDDAHLAPEHALIGRLRREVVKDVAPHADAWSPEFFATLLQTAVVHLRDRLLDDDGVGRPAVVDSYYYKLLAKCRLAGVPEDPLLAWWRTFPQPSRVIYFDVTPETTWRRSRRGADLNLLEYYGERPEWDGFCRYQTDLDKALRDEIQGLPVTVVEEQARPEHVAAAVRQVLAHEFG